MIHMNPLNHAAMKGHNGVISLLLSKGISIDVSNGFGSPLHLACAFGQHDTVNLLLDHNAYPNLLFHEVATSVIHPLHILAMRGEFTQAQFALPRGGDFSHPSFTHLGNAWRIYSRQVLIQMVDQMESKLCH